MRHYANEFNCQRALTTPSFNPAIFVAMPLLVVSHSASTFE